MQQSSTPLDNGQAFPSTMVDVVLHERNDGVLCQGDSDCEDAAQRAHSTISAYHLTMSEVHADCACTVSVVYDGGVWKAVLLFNLMYVM